MNRLLQLVLITTWLAWPLAAVAQQSPSVEQRERQIFGDPASSSDTADPGDTDADDTARSGSEGSNSDESDSDESDSDTPPKQTAPTDPESRRDEKIFGPTSAEPAEHAQTPRHQTDEATTLLEDQMSRRLAARARDVLDIGGGLYSQLRYSVLESGRPEQFPVNQTNYLDVFLDVRPNERLRLYTDGRLTYTPTTSQMAASLDQTQSDDSPPNALQSDDQVDAQLDELWLKFDIARTVYVTAGRQHLRWGVGRFWYPNDFLFEQRRDPLAIFDVRTGVDIVKLNVPVESLGWNFYGVVNLEDADSPEHIGGAFRAEFLAGLTEIGLSAAAKKDNPLQLGADVSTGIGWFDLRAAVAVLHGVDTPFFRGDSNLGDFDKLTVDNLSELTTPDQYSRHDDWIPRILVGGEVNIPYGNDDALYVGAEYFFNDAGYSDADLDTWLLLNGAYQPLYTGRHYGAVYMLIPSPGRWDDSTITLSTLGNLSDRSFLSRLDYSVTVLTHLQAFGFASIAYGAHGEFTQGYHVPAISETVISAAQASGQFDTSQFGATRGIDLSGGFAGIDVPASRAMIGGGLRLDF